MPDEFAPELKISLGGTELSDEQYDLLTEARISLSLHAANRIQLRFLDDDLELLDSLPWSLGDELKAEVSDEDGSLTPVTTCELTSVTVEPGIGNQLEVVLAADDKRHRLMRGVKIRTFLDMKDSDIAAQIAKDHGLSPKTTSTSTKHSYLLQSQSDGAFLTERSRAIGYRWWVQGSDLHFAPVKDVKTTTTLTWGDDLTSFRLAMSSAESSNQTSTRAWDAATQETVKSDKAPKADLDHVGSSAPIVQTLVGQGASLSKSDRFSGVRPVADVSSAGDYASSLAKRAASTQVTARGETIGTPDVKAGVNVTIDGLGKLDGDYLVTAADHIFSAEYGYRTRFVCGSLDGDELVDLLGGTASPASAVLPWSAGHLVIGVVTNIAGKDAGVAKVKFPTLSDKEESTWARIVSVGGGGERGLQVYPEVNDEVLVGFEHGDPTRPLILGGLWSAKNTSPLANTAAIKNGEVVARTWKSRTGHSITFNDDGDKSKQTIVIAHADGKTKIELTPDKVVITTPKDTEYTADGKMTFKAKGDVAIEGNNVSIKAKSNVTVEGLQVSGKGKTKLALEGAQAEVKGSATLKLEGGGITEVKGGLVKLN